MHYSVMLRASFKDWLNTDANVLIFVAKTVGAGILALYISMYLNLPDPRTALFTVFIVMQPKSGLVLSKSFYRIIATSIGAIVSLVLIGSLSQDPLWFIAFFAIWIGICAGASVKYRNFQAYGFILAGYTVAIVALPAIDTPLDVFDIAVSRFSEVFVGIMCATIVSDAVFPTHLSDGLFDSELKRFTSLVSSFSNAQTILEHGEAAMLRQSFFSGVIGLDSVRVNSAFESKGDNVERLHYQHLNNEFMHLSTTLFSLKNCIAMSEQKLPNFAFEDIKKQISCIADVFIANGIKNDEKSIGLLTKQLSTTGKEVSSVLIATKQRLQDVDTIDLFSATLALLVRLVRELKAYFTTFLSLVKIRSSKKDAKYIKSNVKFSTHADAVLVVISVLRGFGLIVISFVFWIYTTWPFAVQAITMAVISGILFGTLPNPTAIIKSFINGALVAFAVVGLWDFYIIPAFTSDILTLAVVISPVLAFAAWLVTMPKWTGFALGFTYMFLTLGALDSAYAIAPTVFVEKGLASIIGLILAAASYIVSQYFVVMFANQRVARALSKLIASICSGDGKLERVKMESTARDLLQQFSTHGKIDLTTGSPIFQWLLTTLEIGQSIIKIKKDVNFIQNKDIQARFEQLLKTLQTVFEKPSEPIIETLMERILSFEMYAKQSMNSNLEAHNEILSQTAIIKTVVKMPNSIPRIGEADAA